MVAIHPRPLLEHRIPIYIYYILRRISFGTTHENGKKFLFIYLFIYLFVVVNSLRTNGRPSSSHSAVERLIKAILTIATIVYTIYYIRIGALWVGIDSVYV
jgi:hypothetical protein